MTRKDFKLIADAVKRADLVDGDDTEVIVKYNVASELAEALAGTNVRFNRERFLEACGVI